MGMTELAYTCVMGMTELAYKCAYVKFYFILHNILFGGLSLI
jgi:hypothetical protein